MKCEICGKGPVEGVSVFRQNELGVVGIWRCTECRKTRVDNAPIDPEVQQITNIIGGGK